MKSIHRIPVVLLAALTLLTACERPPVESTQVGFRGMNMADIQNPRAEMGETGYPAALPPASSSGPKAGEVYQNVQVLGDLSVAEFTRLMTSITAWVSPEEGCNYCHNPANLASDDIYTKVVSRRMIQMNQHINSEWQDHVGANGVNCYTCHRGKNVPEYIWFSQGDSGDGNRHFMGWLNGQNQPGEDIGLTSMPQDVFTHYLTSTDAPTVRLASLQPGVDEPSPGTKNAEKTYALMVNWSQSLGVNCTYCHYTGSFQDWENSSPYRITAHYGLNMVRGLNAEYLIPLEGEYPDYRLGPHEGDAPKAYCATCHQGQKKPLGGADAISAYPSLAE
ncbi:MAG: photosynthetic reaction center cytochrome PufC [Woeseiaceae bacterium]|nr:photosynthetic reaction center cytochrome PufC [Woeseiaceae bacterium]